MKLFLSIAAASLLTLGSTALPQTASAMPSFAGNFTAPSESGVPVHKVTGFDGYGFGIEGDGCGWGQGGGTGYNGCFIFDRGRSGYYGYRGYNGNRNRKRNYDRRSYPGDGYGQGGRRGYRR